MPNIKNICTACLLIIFSSQLFADHSTTVQFIPVLSIRDSLYKPVGFVVTGEKIYVIDPSGNAPVSIFNKSTGKFVGYLGRFGLGPGELSHPNKIDADNKNLYILDSDFSLNIFTLYEGGNTVKQKFTKNYWDIGVSQNGDLIFRGFTRQFLLHFKKFIQDEKRIVDTGRFIRLSEDSDYGICKQNPLINQGPFIYDKIDDNVIIGVNYSTLISLFNPEDCSIIRMYPPIRISVPHGKSGNARKIEAPDAFDHMITYLDFAVDSLHIYALYSGFKPRLWNFWPNRDKIEHGKTLHIFNKKTGIFLTSVDLPKYAMKIIYDNGFLYILSYFPTPSIIKYQIIIR